MRSLPPCLAPFRSRVPSFAAASRVTKIRHVLSPSPRTPPRPSQAIGLVGQDPVLFSGTIESNILYSVQSDEPDAIAPRDDLQPDVAAAVAAERRRMLRLQVEAAARSANAHDFIMEQPDGYQTEVGEFGAFLSGGQQQRLMLARALYRRPAILFMDEGTSHLDEALEHRVNNNLNTLTMTRVIVAHRESTIRLADAVLSIDG